MLEVTNITIICLTVLLGTLMICGTMLALKGMEITADTKKRDQKDF